MFLFHQFFRQNNFLIEDVIEKPSIKEAPSNKAVIGRYILPKTIFNEIKKLSINNLLELINLSEEATWEDKLNNIKALNINNKEIKLSRINHFKHFIDKFENDLISKIHSFM